MAYIGRSGWNNLAFAGAIPDEDLLDAVDESYRLVVEGLPKKLRPSTAGTPGLTVPVRLAGDGEPDQPGDDQGDVQDAGDLLDHHQRACVAEHRQDVGQADAGEVGERQEQQVEERVGLVAAAPTNEPGQITWQATKT